jgi:hypothetical protein
LTTASLALRNGVTAAEFLLRTSQFLLRTSQPLLGKRRLKPQTPALSQKCNHENSYFQDRQKAWPRRSRARA